MTHARQAARSPSDRPHCTAVRPLCGALRRLARFACAAAALAALALAPAASAQNPPLPPGLAFAGSYSAIWPKSSARGIQLDTSERIPVLFPPEPISPNFYLWDWWPVRDPQGRVARIGGYVVMIALSAPRHDNIPGERHAIATWRYFYSNGDRGPWTPGGLVFEPGEALGSRQWAGSTMYDPATNRITFYYTALGNLPPDLSAPAPESPGGDGYEEVYYSGGGSRLVRDPDAEEPPPTDRNLVRQEIVAATAIPVTDGTGLRFVSVGPHEILLKADGYYYATAEQSEAGGGLYMFRDPFFFRDPANGAEYLLFTGASAAHPGPKAGVVGIATRTPAGEWALAPPLLSGVGVNSQLERPNVIVRDGRYYLFFTSHSFSFAEDLSGPEGLYGFVSNGPFFRGLYTPLNGDGLALGNPAYAPLQTYSYLVIEGRQPGEAHVFGFVNYFELGDVSLSEIKLQTREFQKEKFGGTPAPVLTIGIDGEQTELLRAGERPVTVLRELSR